MDSTAAKEFLISKVVEEAKIEQVSLSEIERKMLCFTEVHPTLPDILEVNEEFERNYDRDEYEAKIAGLLKRARDRDGEQSSDRGQTWNEALSTLKNEDHYILVMTEQAFRSRTTGRDLLIYVAVGLGVVLLIILKAFWPVKR